MRKRLERGGLGLGTILAVIAGSSSGLTAPAAWKASAPAAPASSVPAPPPVRPYAMRGVELGITLEEFRAFPIPHDNPNSYQLEVRCLGDAPGYVQGHNWRYLVKEAGVISCGWFAHDKRILPTQVSELWVDLGSGRGAPQFQFVEQDGKYRLFRISVKAHIEYYAGIPDALTRNFGTPTSSTEPFQVLGGATYPATTLAWRNAVSTIATVDHCEELKRYCLTYEHTGLRKLYDALVDQRGAAAASKI